MRKYKREDCPTPVECLNWKSTSLVVSIAFSSKGQASKIADRSYLTANEFLAINVDPGVRFTVIAGI